MLAMRIHHDGNRDALSLDDISVPPVGPDESLVKVAAASVDAIDWKVGEGHLARMMPQALPLTPGWHVSGVVAMVGKSVLLAGTP